MDEVYPPGFDTTVSVGAVARPLEGAARPGHFDGVATVVAILFGLVGAERAYFGQKDAQQVMVIRRMARDLAIADRGHRLPHGPRARRPGALVAQRPPLPGGARRGAGPAPGAARGRARWAAGERSGDALRATMREILAAEPLAERRLRLVADGTTLAELDRVDGPALALAGGPVRVDPPDRQRAARLRRATASASSRTGSARTRGRRRRAPGTTAQRTV